MKQLQNRLAITVQEAADTIGISQSKMYLIIAAGDIKVLKIGRSSRIRITELERYLDSLEQEVR